MQIISTTVPTARHQAYCAWSLQISKKEFDVFISFFLNVEHMERIHRRLRTYGGTAFSLSAHSRFFFLPCSILTGWAAFTRSLYSYPLRFWYAALTTPSDFISLMDSISRWPATQQHTGSVSVETHAPQPRQTASTAETLLHSPLRNFSFSSHMHTHTHIWAGGRRRLSLVKGRDNVSNREPLRSVSAGREAAGRPPAANKDDKCPLSISHSTTVSED